MYCWKCGKEIPDGSKFCSYCGVDTKAAPASAPLKAAGEKKEFGPYIAIGAIVLLILIAVTIVIGMVSSAEKAAPVPTSTALAETAAPTPVPTETPVPTPTATPRPRFISPEQYAMENGLSLPEDGSSGWSSKKNIHSEGFNAWGTAIKTAQSWDENFQSSHFNRDMVYTYADIYMQARADGRSDTEAHALALEETDIDKRILGKEEYTQFIYDSALEAGVSDYDAEQFAEQECVTWDAAWDAYKYSRDSGKSHEQAIDSVNWRCFSSGSAIGFAELWNRVFAYREHEDGAWDRANDEQAKLFESFSVFGL